MISFLPNTDAHHDHFARGTVKRSQHPRYTGARPPQQIHDQSGDAPADCPRLCPSVDYPAILQLSSSLSLSHDNLEPNIRGDIVDLSPQAMQSDTWGVIAQSTPKLGRTSHQRESSLSSLGSAGPASPFATHMSSSNPHIAVSESALEGFADIQSNDMSAASHGGAYYQFAKPMAAFPGCGSLDATTPDTMGYPMTIPGPSKKPRRDRNLLPAPDLAVDNGRSGPISAASSIAGDSPATPNLTDTDNHERRRTDYCNVPKLDRTMTDVYGDELYSPNFAITSTSPSNPLVATSPSNDVFSQRINAANNQHLSAVHSPSSIARARSPFRTDSPFASSIPRQSFGVFDVARKPASRGTLPSETEPSRARSTRAASVKAEPETPKTISPKDAVLEFSDADTNSNFSLFPQDATALLADHIPKEPLTGQVDMQFLNSVEPSGMDSAESLNFIAGHGPSSVVLHQQYPFVVDAQHNQLTPPRMHSSKSSTADSGNSTPTNMGRPTGTGADGGTYTCTYHGCTLRFETPLLLQKHKREGHRQTHGLGAPRETRAASPSGLLNTQAGPHRCDRINPSTGKPCNTVFSRPYDLTRHEDTIHNARKQKVRCDLCTEEKTFSRADALTRHYRVCHPDMELPGKHRRRAG
ncbi:hypothetical protein HIM_01661 [Hirsutella minnesotensis 3608]|nr:hypothetical protein HIM_01661 [Hirsutella minnesotensis 3608]